MSNVKKKNKILDLKYLYFFSGICLCLLAVILIINVGYIARTVAFVPFFLFGISSCALYFGIYAIGLYILLQDKAFKFRFKITIPAFIILFLGLIVTTTLTTCSKDPNVANHYILTLGSSRVEGDINFRNFSNSFIEIFKGIPNGYYGSKFLHMFNKSPYGGGYLGFLLTAFLNDYLGVAATKAISISFVVVGALMLVGPFVISFIVKKVKKHKEEQSSINPKTKEEVKILPNPRPTPVVTREVREEINPISTPVIEKTVTPVSRPTPTPVITTHSLYEDDFQGVGTFVPARFLFNNRVNDVSSGIETMQTPTLNPVTLTPVTERVEETVSPIRVDESPVIEESFFDDEPTHVEQMTLDFEEKDDKTPELATVQPTFAEPVVVKQNHNPSIVPTPTEHVRKKRIKFIPPSVDLLNTYEITDAIEENTEVANARMLITNETFENFRVGAEVTGFTIGPAVTRFHVTYKPGVSVKTVANVVSNLCINLGGVDVRFEPLVAGERYSGLEVPNAVITTIGFKDVFNELPDATKKPLNIPFGKNISGKTIFGDYGDFPHMLVAGTTGSGKSVFVHSVIATLIMRNSPDDFKLILIDPKMVEMAKYVDMPHLLCPIIYEAKEAKVAFDRLVEDMDNRYSLMRSAGVSSIKEYNEIAESLDRDPLPRILVIIDEYADLVEQCKEIQVPVTRISAKARAAGIHLLVATQRPSVNVVTGVLKSNLPTHVALKTSNYTDSMTILNEGGAEKLLGKGDMLVQSSVFAGQGLIRIQSPFIKGDEISMIVNYLKENYETDFDPRYLDLVDHSKENAKTNMIMGGFSMGEGDPQADPDEHFYLAVKEWVMTLDTVSGSKIQKQFSTGYPRAIRIFRRLQEEGIVEDNNNPSSSKGCRVLVHDKFYGETGEDNPALDEDNY